MPGKKTVKENAEKEKAHVPEKITEIKAPEAAKPIEKPVEKKAPEAAKPVEKPVEKKAPEAAKPVEKPVEKKAPEAAKPIEKPVEKKAPEAAKPVEKPVEKKAPEAAKPVEKPVEKKAPKAAKLVEKPVEKKAPEAAKPVEKPVEKKAPEAAKLVEKPVEKKAPEAVKPVEKPAEKKAPEAAKPVEKPVEKKAPEAAKPVEKPVEKKAPKAEKAAEKPAEKKAPARKRTAKKAAKPAEVPAEAPEAVEAAAKAPVNEEPAKEEPVVEEPVIEEPVNELPQPRRSVAFIGSECYPFIKTGGLGDVMYALPRALTRQNCDVKVILPRYGCIPEEYQRKMVYRGAFMMDLCSDGRSFYVGIMEYVHDGVVYDFIDNNDFFSWGNPYTDLVRDIPKFCYFAKAALAALNYMDWIPDVIHCHDWQAALTPVYLRTLFADSPVGRAKSILTIHNLRFQGIYNIPTIRYWTGLPGYVFEYGYLKQGYEDANMLKGGLAFADMITTVSNTYAWEIQTAFYGENLDAHLRFHSGKLRGIVNGIDVDLWNSAADKLLAAPYDGSDVLEKKKANKLALQEALGLEQNENKMVIGLISRLTDQKGLDLVNAIFQQLIDGNTQIVVLGTGEKRYEDAFRYYENTNRGTVCAYISYNESLAHQIYAGADALLVPSLFEPCGLTQLIAMRYGTVPIVRETGGLKDTVEPYNEFENRGNGFTFDRYEAGLLLDAINRAKTVYFTDRVRWDEMVQRNMAKDVSWDNSARQYRDLYLQLRP